MKSSLLSKILRRSIYTCKFCVQDGYNYVNHFCRPPETSSAFFKLGLFSLYPCGSSPNLQAGTSNDGGYCFTLVAVDGVRPVLESNLGRVGPGELDSDRHSQITTGPAEFVLKKYFYAMS